MSSVCFLASSITLSSLSHELPTEPRPLVSCLLSAFIANLVIGGHGHQKDNSPMQTIFRHAVKEERFEKWYMMPKLSKTLKLLS
jgi:hypothetical protein